MENRNFDDENDEVMRSFAPRSVVFDTVRTSRELGSQPNDSEDIRTKITQKEFRGGVAIANVTRVCYGTYEAKKAALIVIKVILVGSPTRLRHFEIVVTFKPRPKKHNPDNDNKHFPILRNLSPRKVFGLGDDSSQAWCFRVDKQCLTSASPSSPAPSTTQRSVITPASTARLSIIGQAYSDSRQQEMHKACWTVDEKSKGRGKDILGLPDEITLGVVVESCEKFQAEVMLMLDLPWYAKSPAFPWSKDHPILFPKWRAGVYVGQEPSTMQFDLLSDRDWAEIVSSSEIRSVVATPPGSKNTEPSQKQRLVYRLKGIPSGLEPADVLRLVRETFGISEQGTDIGLRSLTEDFLRDNEMVATISSASPSLGASLGARNISNIDGTLSPSISVTLDDSFEGFTLLAQPAADEDHLFDIIAIHGLGGQAYRSFKERDGDHMWLLDDLPNEFPQARVLTYGYESKLEKSQSIQSIEDIANTFGRALKIARPKDVNGQPNHKPIIFIVHSLGGILLKQALVLMADGDAEDVSSCQAIRAILFFGVPSQGIDITTTMAMVRGQANESLLQGIRLDSNSLRALHREFCKAFPYKSCKIISFYETQLSPTARKGSDGKWRMDGEPALLVGPSSATMGSRWWECEPNFYQEIPRNHSELVKFHQHDYWYSIVRGFLKVFEREIKQA